jgi:hypothetical protein
VREVRVPCETFQVHAFCECGGEFQRMGAVHTSFPPAYEHMCMNCKKTERFKASYPYTLVNPLEEI